MTSTDTSTTVTRTIQAPANEIFNLLTNPDRHPALDGSGMVISEDTNDRIQGTGEVFRMNMNNDILGDYKTENHVVGYESNQLLAWQTAPAGEEPAGWQWIWELNSTDDDTTEVSVTYDWKNVSAENVEKFNLPLITEEQLEGSLGNLAAAMD